LCKRDDDDDDDDVADAVMTSRHHVQQSRWSYDMFRKTVYQMTGGHGRDVVDPQRVEQSLAFGEVTSSVPVALERRRVVHVVGVVVVAAAADLEVGPVVRSPVVEAGSTSAAGEDDHSDEDDRIDSDEDD